jgi:hypothetical protein
MDKNSFIDHEKEKQSEKHSCHASRMDPAASNPRLNCWLLWG